jgi:hypothetical protein
VAVKPFWLPEISKTPPKPVVYKCTACSRESYEVHYWRVPFRTRTYYKCIYCKGPAIPLKDVPVLFA